MSLVTTSQAAAALLTSPLLLPLQHLGKLESEEREESEVLSEGLLEGLASKWEEGGQGRSPSSWLPGGRWGGSGEGGPPSLTLGARRRGGGGRGGRVVQQQHIRMDSAELCPFVLNSCCGASPPSPSGRGRCRRCRRGWRGWRCRGGGGLVVLTPC